ncbi:copper homeostasis protein CutC [Levilactobacillus zymae]|uniref:Copper homeostasis protein cutC homolog n=1 Tax=Levilactobacillus zymae TaxID=267363 RepID=A0A1Y6JVP8_9LACO|nr:copper homeostasis protein CutC [Levilactobacillus zymae]KRL12311.1 copper resistance protein [Levilactobacillus zymae DSM 19395]QFR60937.1 copper resistance protein [Levilactobacillus zymae]GEO73223.1 copper homeostasis protein [Levilactobacillus zymae]SMS13998.1 Cytoplasmic copper homeostasis protein cutC [Levilactobacillus zymae]
MRLIEPLLENYGPLLAATEAGAKRVALADNLAVGGTTVSKGVMGEAVRYAHEHRMSLDLVIAPRGGNTPYDDVEIKIMEADLLEAQQLGVDGVILGALDANRRIDREGLRPLVAAAGGMTMTFSTDWDAIRPQDRGGAIDWLATQGFERVLSAGDPADRLADWTATKRLTDSAGLTLVPAEVAATDIPQVADALKVNFFLGTNSLTL